MVWGCVGCSLNTFGDMVLHSLNACVSFNSGGCTQDTRVNGKPTRVEVNKPTDTVIILKEDG